MGAALLAVAAVGWPVARQPQRDSFPLSTYPMFTQLRPRQAAIEVAVGLDAGGQEVRLEPELVGGTVEVIHAVATLGRSIAAGQAGQICDEIAFRVRGDQRPDLVEVVVASDVYDIVDALVRPEPPRQRQVHARCEVGR